MLPSVLLMLMSSALVHAQTYQLRVYAGNDEVHKSLLRFGDTQAAFVAPESESADYPAIRIQRNPDDFGSLLVRESNDTRFVTQYLALLGPNGRYRIVASEHPEGFDPNADFMSDRWVFLERDGRTVLRFRRESDFAGSWVMEKKDEGWILWWYEPREENMGDLGEYVLVDVEVERVEDAEIGDAERTPAEGEADRDPGAGIYEGGWNEKGEWTGEGKWPGEGQSGRGGARSGGRGGRGGGGGRGGRGGGAGRRGPRSVE